MPVNVEHLNKIKQHILEEPARLYMSDWIKFEVPGTMIVDESQSDWGCTVPQKVPECGTVCCIAGWSAMLRGLSEVNTFKESAFLGVSSLLFHITDWPNSLFQRWKAATTLQEKAQIAADAIDQIIAGDGYFD